MPCYNSSQPASLHHCVLLLCRDSHWLATRTHYKYIYIYLYIYIYIYMCRTRFIRVLGSRSGLKGITFLSLIVYKYLADTAFIFISCINTDLGLVKG